MSTLIPCYLLVFHLLLPFVGGAAFGPEICDNARDDDGDGLIDLNDTDCECTVAEPVSLIPNPSFEEQKCCPSNRSQLNCSETWIQASEATTDYLHTCGWMGWENLPPPLPFPDGNACVGFRDGRSRPSPQPNWKEYAGACLQSPLRKGTAYRFEFYIGFTHIDNSPPIDVTFFGSTNCSNLPFGQGNDAFGCPTNGPGWKRLGARSVSGANNWVKTTIDITPSEDIYAIAIGPACQERPSNVDLYYFFDNLILADERSFEFRISAVNHPCSESFALQVPAYDSLHYQWYKEGIALVGETKPQLQVETGPGLYQVRITSALDCKVTPAFRYTIPRFSGLRRETICEGETLLFNGRHLASPGRYLDTLKNANNCDSIVELDLRIQGLQRDTVRARIFDSEKFEVGPYAYKRPGQYLVGLQSTLGCDSIIYLDLGLYQVFIPNAFSPDDDGINDRFAVFGGPDLVLVKRLLVFDRWGDLLFEGHDLPPNETQYGWNGRYRGKTVPAGVYVYLAELVMDDGITRSRKGSVMLMK